MSKRLLGTSDQQLSPLDNVCHKPSRLDADPPNLQLMPTIAIAFERSPDFGCGGASEGTPFISGMPFVGVVSV